MSVGLKTVALWLAILVVAILNGALRESALIPCFGSVTGLVVSGILLCICIFLVALAAVPWYGPLVSRRWLWIGLCWLLLTLIFEFSFGYIAQHKSFTDLLAAYTFSGGNIWPVVLVVTFASPWIAAQARGFI